MTDNDYRRRLDLRMRGIDPDTMQPLVKSSVTYVVAPHAAAPALPTGYVGTGYVRGYVDCGDGETRIGCGCEVELQRLRSEIALRDRCIAWLKDHLGVIELDGEDVVGCIDGDDFEVPAEFAAIIGGVK